MRAKVSVPEIELGAFHLLARGDHLARVVVRHDARSSVATLDRAWTRTMDGQRSYPQAGRHVLLRGQVGRGNLEWRDVMYKRCLMLKKWFLERWCRHRRRLVTFMGKPPAV